MSRLLDRHKQTFFVQRYVPVEDPWGGGWGVQKELQDGEAIQAVMIPDQSAEFIAMGGQQVRTRGRLIVPDINAPIDYKDRLRHEKSGIFISLDGEPLEVDGLTIRGKRFLYTVTDRPLGIITEGEPPETDAEAEPDTDPTPDEPTEPPAPPGDEWGWGG